MTRDGDLTDVPETLKRVAQALALYHSRVQNLVHDTEGQHDWHCYLPMARAVIEAALGQEPIDGILG